MTLTFPPKTTFCCVLTKVLVQHPVFSGNADILREVHFVEIACGYGHNLAVVAGSGQIYSWGANLCGQLGVGDQNDRYLPTLIEDLVSTSSRNLNPVFNSMQSLEQRDVLSSSPSLLHKTSSTHSVSEHGEHRKHIVLPPSDPFDAPPPPSSMSIEHKEDGSNVNVDGDGGGGGGDGAERVLHRRNAVSADDGVSAQSALDVLKMSGLQKNENPVIKVGCGAFHSAALTTEGDVLCWGDNSDGQLGIGDISGTAGTVMVWSTGF